MAPLPIPPQLKKITQYVRRAEELDHDTSNVESRLVAYYCRQYAVQTGIPLASGNSECNAALGSILEVLEGDRAKMGNFTKDECYSVCRSFALKIFGKADREDRSGGAGKGTAKAFYAAASFLDILKQFDCESRTEEMATEEEKKSFYAKWKSTDILKALKEGREPTPGGYEEEGGEETETAGAEGGDVTVDANTHLKQEEEEEEEEGGDEGIEVPFVPLPPPLPPQQDETDTTTASSPPPPPYRPPMTMPPPPPSQPTPPSPPRKPSPVRMFSKKAPPSKPAPPPSTTTTASRAVSKDAMKDAKEYTKVAIKALDKKNPKLAASNLQKALQFLGRPSSGGVGSVSSNIGKDAMMDAKELSKFGNKALDVKDANLAVERLEQALSCLGV